MALGFQEQSKFVLIMLLLSNSNTKQLLSQITLCCSFISKLVCVKTDLLLLLYHIVVFGDVLKKFVTAYCNTQFILLRKIPKSKDRKIKVS